MSAAEHAALVRYLIEAVWDRGDLSVLDRFIADDVVVHTHTAIPVVKQMTRLLGSAAPHYRAVEEVSAGDDRVLVRYRAYRMPSVPQHPMDAGWPRPVYSGTNIYRVVGGQIKEIWVFLDCGTVERHSRQKLLQPGSDHALGGATASASA
jgi:hypothetical protein